MALKNAESSLIPRVPELDFTEVPTVWYQNSPTLTFYEDTISIIVCEWEDFTVRAIQDALNEDLPTDDVLRTELQTVCTQEHNHSNAHNLNNERLTATGIDVDSIASGVRKFATSFDENCTLPERLIIAGAVEALASAVSLNFMRNVANGWIINPEMLKLYYWHALEELEHRHVVFDLLKQIQFERSMRTKKLFARFSLFQSRMITSSVASMLYSTGYWKQMRLPKDLFKLLLSPRSPAVISNHVMLKYVFSASYHPKTYVSDEDVVRYETAIENMYPFLKGYSQGNSQHISISAELVTTT